MIGRMLAAILISTSAPALAQGDEIAPVPAQALIGHPYVGLSSPSRILFINVRDRPVRIMWIRWDGNERAYATLAQGEQCLQPTFVAHRWIVRDAEDGTPLEGFISTRSAELSAGTPQIALIR